MACEDRFADGGSAVVGEKGILGCAVKVRGVGRRDQCLRWIVTCVDICIGMTILSSQSHLGMRHEK